MGTSPAKQIGGVSRNGKRYISGSLTDTFGNNIREAMAGDNLSPADLAQMCDVSGRQIYRIINCEASTSLEMAEILCAALGINLEDAIK